MLEKQIYEQIVDGSNPPEMITISKKEYSRLVEREYWLQCLEEAGVDNWAGYDYARELEREGQEA